MPDHNSPRDIKAQAFPAGTSFELTNETPSIFPCDGERSCRPPLTGMSYRCPECLDAQ